MSVLRPEHDTGDAADDVALRAVHDVVPDADGVRSAREFVRQTLTRWVVEQRAANAALDVANELVSNAVRHAAPPVTLTLVRDSSSITIWVGDSSAEPARRLPYRSGLSERGLGLRLVGQLSQEWGQQFGAEGKVVWARVRAGSRRGSA